MVNIQVDERVAAALAERASACGLRPDEYLATLFFPVEPTQSKLTGEEILRLIEAESGDGNTEYKGTYSREDIYFDHD